ncbi:MAG TPA: methyltransferase domain-containing protein, partial [Acidimicrobiales bacterium]|nr:methyltransferase domain-containing protein [Acidimicrobiales bacterium]
VFHSYLRELAAQAEIQRYKRVAYALCRLEAGAEVLDVGCGVGDDVFAIARRVAPTGSVVGVDRSAAMIAECRRRAPSGAPVRFEVAVGDSLPFEDARFDIVRADRVLIHVEDPAAVVREMVRVAKPNGRVVLTEGDFETLVIDSDDPELARQVGELSCAAFRSGRVGRSLAGLLRLAGVEEVSSAAESIVFRELWRAERFWGLARTVSDAIRGGRLPLDRTERWLADQRERDLEGRFFCSLTGFAAVGTKARDDLSA